MLFRLSRPMKRQGSNNQQFVQRIPADVRDRAVGMKLDIPVGAGVASKTVTAKDQAIRVSLRTFVPGEVKVRQAQVIAYLESVWATIRGQRILRLDHEQAHALSAKLYHAMMGETERGIDFDRPARDGRLLIERTTSGPLEPALAPPSPDSLDGILRQLDDSACDLEAVLGATADKLIFREGYVRADPESRMLLLDALADKLRLGTQRQQARLSGDYTEDRTPDRFPEWKPKQHVTPSAAHAGSGLTLDAMFAGWWAEAEKANRTWSTRDKYEATTRLLKAFVKHNDAARVTPADIVAFKDHRLKEVGTGTVGAGDLSSLRSMFDWALANRYLPSNPVAGIKVKSAKVVRVRDRGLSETEAAAALAHSAGVKIGSRAPKRDHAKRWVPWLCAYTGARVGEMAQLRKHDFRQESDGAWVVRITPEAGTVKDKEARDVMIHEHLIAEGLIDFVTSAPAGYLFLDADAKGEVRGPWRTVKNKVAVFVREVVTDPNVPPNHGWRHAFKTVGREAGIADSVLDGICGHAAKTVGGSYGTVSLKAQREAMAKFPRYGVR